MSAPLRLPDHGSRVTAMTVHDRSLLVEAGAGVGKTAVMAGRIVLLLARGIAPGSIAAVTFTELAAGELLARVRAFADALTTGNVPVEMAGALPDGLDEAAGEALLAAIAALDDMTCSTIHGFCQRLIIPYPVEAGIDPGAAVLDADEAGRLFEETLEAWLREALSATDGSILPELVFLRPEATLALVKDVASELRKEAGLNPPRCAGDPSENARVFVRAAHAYADFAGSAPAEEPETLRKAECFGEMAAEVETAVERGAAAALAKLLTDRPHQELCKADGDFRKFQQKGKWATAAAKSGLSKGDGAALFEEAERLHEACCRSWSELVSSAAGKAIADLLETVRPAMERYRERKRAAARLDFDDLILSARDLLRHQPAVRDALAARYRYVLVDEFQDTDPRQAEIFWRLAAESPGEGDAPWQDLRLRPGALFLVGDPKQSIYRFRGADAAAYRGARDAIRREGSGDVITITTNFRSCAPIIGFVNNKFREPLSGEDQPGFAPLDAFHPDPRQGPCVAALNVLCADTEGKADAETKRDCEAEAVAELCARLIERQPLPPRTGREERTCRPGDIALLAPTGAELWRYEEALERHGVPVATQAGKGLFRRQEIQDLIAVTRVLTDPRDTLALAALLRGPLVGLSDEEMLDLAWQSRADQGPTRLTFDVEPEQVTHPLARATLARLQSLRRRTNSTTPHSLLAEAVDALRVKPMLTTRHRGQAARALANVDAFLDLSRPYALRGLRAFCDTMRASWENGSAAAEGRPDAPEEAVALYTVHASKGLEWPVVIPVNMMTRAGQPPRAVVDRIGSTLHMKVLGVAPPGHTEALAAEEAEARRERQRLWYVAATRARDLLVLPKLDARAAPASWSALVDLGLDEIPPLVMPDPPAPARSAPVKPETPQTRQAFAAEARAISDATRAIRWSAPSSDEGLEAEPIDSATTVASGTVGNVAGSAARGIVLHKLIEEILTGEATDEPAALAARAAELAVQLGSPAPVHGPEVAEAALRALGAPQLMDLRNHLIPEVPVLYSEVGEDGVERVVSGVADALSVDEEGRPQIIVDWKSDVAPSAAALAHYRGQVRRYMEATGAAKGLIVLATSGAVIEVQRD